MFCAPPTEFRLLVKEDLARFAVPRLRECVSAGEPLNPEVIRAWREATGITIRDGYGQTETILLVGNYPGQAVRPGAMGLPMPGIRVEVIDERGEPLPPGEVGDIAVHGQPPGLSREYWKDPRGHRARAPRRLVPDRRPRLARRGRLLLVRRPRRRRDHLGRLPDRPVRGGERADRAPRRGRGRRGGRARPRPRLDREGVRRAARRACAPSDALARELQEHVKRVTAPYKYPRAIEFAKELPKTVSGKIRRVELRERR